MLNLNRLVPAKTVSMKTSMLVAVLILSSAPALFASEDQAPSLEINKIELAEKIVGAVKVENSRSFELDESKSVDGEGLTDEAVQSDPFKFCNSLTNVFLKYGVSQGLSKSRSYGLASNASASLIKRLRSGDRTEYISTESLAFNEKSADSLKYFQLATVLGESMKLKGKVIMGFNVRDLRYLPQVQRGSHILLMLDDARGLSVRRAKLVRTLSAKLAIKISVVWVGKEKFNSAKSRALRGIEFITVASQGELVDLGGKANVCSTFL